MQKTTMLPEDYQFNLSDFALFLSVMKNPTAYQNALSIIMDEPDIKIKEVKEEPMAMKLRFIKKINMKRQHPVPGCCLSFYSISKSSL